MKPEDFRKYRTRLFHYRTDAARALGVTAKAICHWEAGRRKVPGWAVKFLECIEVNRALSVQQSGIGQIARLGSPDGAG